MERRLYTVTAKSVTFANLFTMLVGPPGAGKTKAIEIVEDLWNGTRNQRNRLRTAPHSITKAAFVDAVASARQSRIYSTTEMCEYATLLVPCSELGVLISSHDLDFLSALSNIYDCPHVYREQRRTFNKGKQIEIIRPQLSLLAGATPGFLGSLLPEEAWSQGFMSRMIMIFSADPPQVVLFASDDAQAGDDPERKAMRKKLQEELIHILELKEQALYWTPDAKTLLEGWHAAKCPPAPQHSKLQNYCTRRILHMVKLCMISAISRTGQCLIHEEDVNRARDWLLNAEQLMPDIFRAMVGKSDSTVIQNLHFYLWAIWNKQARKPIHSALIWNYLSTQVPSLIIPRIIETAMRANVIARLAGTEEYYTPRPLHEHGVE